MSARYRSRSRASVSPPSGPVARLAPPGPVARLAPPGPVAGVAPGGPAARVAPGGAGARGPAPSGPAPSGPAKSSTVDTGIRSAMRAVVVAIQARAAAPVPAAERAATR